MGRDIREHNKEDTDPLLVDTKVRHLKHRVMVLLVSRRDTEGLLPVSNRMERHLHSMVDTASSSKVMGPNHRGRWIHK